MRGLVPWIDERFPLTKVWEEHVSKYYAPKNFNFWYYFGSFALLVLVIQLVTGIFLTMHYKPSVDDAFGSVEYIMRDVPWGWMIRYLHSTGASLFFVVVYLHMFRALLYGSYKKPRELIWLIGVVIFIMLMAEAFFGYLLPWGNMSYWGAQVIISLFGALPVIGDGLATWIRGDFVVSDATLNRFFAFHVILLPLLLVGLVFLHIVALHKVGSNNPDGIEIKEKKDDQGRPLDGVPFHPYYTVKDSFGAVVFLFVCAFIVFFVPEFGGWFLEHDNFRPADILQTPPEIVPLWYLTPFYSVLRAVTDTMIPVIGIVTVGLAAMAVFSVRDLVSRVAVIAGAAIIVFGLVILEAKVWGVLLMGLALVLLFFLPWLDRAPVRSIRYRGPLFRLALLLFIVSFVILGYLGTQRPTPASTLLAQVCTVIYFLFFLLMPWYTTWDSTRPVPDRVKS
jgi:ubiquinol-cytochrome c reductase cytochrome b subunit